MQETRDPSIRVAVEFNPARVAPTCTGPSLQTMARMRTPWAAATRELRGRLRRGGRSAREGMAAVMKRKKAHGI
jgi:hypothetical protein